MKSISPANYNNLASFRNNNTLQQPQKTFAQKIEANNDKVLQYPPIVIGLMNAFCWTTVGLAFDKLCSKVFKMNSSGKISIFVNGLLGIGMGIYSYCQANKLQKNAKTQSFSSALNTQNSIKTK